MKKEKMSNFYITYEKETEDIKTLILNIKNSEWVEPNLILVNCFPEYSARVTQMLNHKLSFLNKNELFETIDLQMPYPNMSQIWNTYEKSYQLFTNYLSDWVRFNINTKDKYLFISAAQNLDIIKRFIKMRIESSNYRLATLYIEEGDPSPDFYTEIYNKQKTGDLLFEWENMENPNWKH